MSCMLLMMLMMPIVMSNERAVAVIIRELSPSHCRRPVCTRKVKRGMSMGVERTNAVVTMPLMIPTTKAATIVIL